MSIEIEERYANLSGFYFLLAITYEKISMSAERWKDKKDLRTIFNRIKDKRKEVIRSKGIITRIQYNYEGII